MSTNPIPEVAVSEHLLVHGPTKVSILTKVAGLSETSTRKLLKRLEAEGKVTKDGHFYAISAEEKDDAPAPSATLRANVNARDQLVFKYVAEHASDDEHTVSRAEIAAELGLPGSHAYLSLYRLHQAGEVERVHVGKRAPEWRVAYHRD